MNPEPLYKDLRRKLIEGLAQGRWMPGDRLPPEPVLANQYRVSISTVRAAISQLVTSGILIRNQGRGTFVAAHDLDRSRYSFSNLYDHLGNKVLSTRQILTIKKCRPDAETMKILQLFDRLPNSIYKVSALLNVDKQPAAVMTVILPVWIFPRFGKSGLKQTEENLYAIFQKLYGVTVVHMNETISAGKANACIAKQLNIKANDPVLNVNRVSYTYNDIPVEIRKRTFQNSYNYIYKQDHVRSM
ncbi:MAG: GntR family transcriptional regulator [Burkholderiales bacterium]|nr:GntR family transcriptional regulator [Burkholderiales bacterium]